ncbi:hypothetical protein [Paenibacillus sp. JCM 10914]
MQGRNQGNFDPRAEATRAEAVSIILKLLAVTKIES